MDIRRENVKQFTGENFDELKEFVPKLEKYTFREGVDYTVGWNTTEENGDGVDAFTEALPGFYIVKQGSRFRIYDEAEFNQTFDIV